MGSPKIKISPLGIDLAKQVFQLHGVDELGQAVLRKKLTRKNLLAFIAQLEPCLIGLEACSSSNYWAREMMGLGHDVRPYGANIRTNRMILLSDNIASNLFVQ